MKEGDINDWKIGGTMTKWVWDISEKICINISEIQYFEITEFNGLYELFAVISDFNDKLKIVQSQDLGILKDKIRTIISE